MNRKLHTKPTFNTTSHLLAKTKSLGVYGVFVTLSALFTMTAQAELVDLSNPEPVINFASREASWLKTPSFYKVVRSMDRGFTNCTYYIDGDDLKPCGPRVLKILFSLQVDKQGNIKDIRVIESSGVEKVDRMTIRELYKAQFKPFLIKGRPVEGRVTLPVEFQLP